MPLKILGQGVLVLLFFIGKRFQHIWQQWPWPLTQKIN